MEEAERWVFGIGYKTEMAWKNDQVSGKETKYIINTARECMKLPGDVVEMGCYRGDTSLLLAEVVENFNKNLLATSVKPVENSDEETAEKVDESSDGKMFEKANESSDGDFNNREALERKTLHLYDSFEGLPEKRAEDESVLGEEFTRGALGVSKREVKERFLRAGLKVPVIHKGWFSELIPDEMPEKIAFVFIDGDFYESIRDALKLVAPLMTSGGVILIHDYNNLALPGVKKATDEWTLNRGVKIEIFETMGAIRI